jgi:Fur family ferric uptake transcriptional regulator
MIPVEHAPDVTEFLTDSRKVGRLAAMTAAPDFVHQLRCAGMRVTRPRLAVMAAVHAHPHSDTDAITTAVRRDLPAVSHQAVYDCLNALTTTGLIRRIQPSRSVARYDPRTGDNHHHLVCRECGTIVDVDCAVGDAPCLAASDSFGFLVDEAEVIYWGRCPECANQTLPDDPQPSRNTV